MKWVTGISAALAVAAMPLATANAQQAETPDSATVAAGKEIYEGRGMCVSCHGRNGEGILGPTTRLDADKKWLHHDGSLEAIIAVIKAGIDDEKSSSGIVMPPRGGSRITDEQVRQVAAYVQQVLHRRKNAQ
jgi:mono/diheme cytochrome c family protein